MKTRFRPDLRPQRGAAALIVVMLLFFIISMVAAYASRNLIFEQKTSANQLRATQAFEAADAGLEWAVAMLNGGRIDADCAASTDVANNTFRARYLTIELGGAGPLPDGSFKPRPWVDAGVEVPLRPGCVRTDAGWACSCPDGGNPVLAAPVGTGSYPAFRLQFELVGQPGAVRVLSTGCTRLDETCLNAGQGTAGEAAATVSVVVAISSALATPPSAALTVRGNLDVGGAAIRLRNTDPSTNGITASVGGTATAPNALLTTVPGSPAEASIVASDASLSTLTTQQMFTSLFRMAKETYKQQPGAVHLDDCASACSAKLLASVQANPGRIHWIDGDMTLDANVVLGSATEPVLIVSTGSINLDAASVQVYGLLYSQAATWSNAGLGAVTVRGAAVAEGNYSGNGIPIIEYDPAILKLLSLSTGALVRVPGSWRDF
jgi:PilX N-terminal